tara:strand:- start:9969 stop:10622 length:654 start_codon:yes stop_codon:yes gene_type:complete
MNDDKSFQLFRNEDDEIAHNESEASAGGNARSGAVFIGLLMLVIAGAVTVLVIKLSSDDQRSHEIPKDPNMYMIKPDQFMNDINSTIGEFVEFLEAIDDEMTPEDAEQAFAEHIDRIETVANQSMNMGEPTDEERPMLTEKVDELKTLVLRLGTIEQQKQGNRELWKSIGPHYSRFEAAMRMIPMIPPAGYVDPNPEIPEPVIPDVESPEAETSALP